VTIRGTGFISGTTVTVGGTATSVVPVDAATLSVVTAGLPAGATQIVLQNPGGSSYSLDAAFVVQ